MMNEEVINCVYLVDKGYATYVFSDRERAERYAKMMHAYIKEVPLDPWSDQLCKGLSYYEAHIYPEGESRAVETEPSADDFLSWSPQHFKYCTWAGSAEEAVQLAQDKQRTLGLEYPHD